MRMKRARESRERNNNPVYRYWRYLPAVAVMITIFFLSSRTGDQMDSWLPWAQKWLPFMTDFNPMHYVAYFGLALTLAFGFGKHAARWTGCVLNVAICVVYGITDEWHQSFVPMRSPDVNDLLHDAIGAAAAALLVYLIANWIGYRSTKNYTAR
ncbi:VanZ family protein [Cohnella yongneupensis]|uniref:VanZ family protein n=1 Tax=Cohnella yongneupensis TaxID=425006 RepID=A0ABW0R6C1_9BACL